jgi:hypothetical protein
LRGKSTNKLSLHLLNRWTLPWRRQKEAIDSFTLLMRRVFAKHFREYASESEEIRFGSGLLARVRFWREVFIF